MQNMKIDQRPRFPENLRAAPSSDTQPILTNTPLAIRYCFRHICLVFFIFGAQVLVACGQYQMPIHLLYTLLQICLIPIKTTLPWRTEVPAAGWTQWFLFLGLIEKGLYTYDPTRAPGDFKNAGGPGWLGSWVS